MNLLYLTIFQLSIYKVYIGHSKLNSILLSSWLIFNFRGKISILNLFNTIKMLKLSYNLVKHFINLGLPIWFINFDLAKEFIIKKYALQAGEFFLTKRWVRGLISNYYIITKAYRKYLIKKEYIDINRVKDIYDKWLFTRFTWPRALFISNVKTTYIISKEAISAKVPIMALVDTNVKNFFYNLPIGANDDSIDSIGFMNNIITQYIIQSKYKKILLWYFFNRDITRLKGLFIWLQKLIKLKKKIIYKINVKKMSIPNYIDYSTEIIKGLHFFWARNNKFKLLKKKKDFFNNLNLDKFYNVYKYILYNKLKVLNYKNLINKYKIKLKRFKFLKKIEGATLFKSFLNNFIKLTNNTKGLRSGWKKKIGIKKVSNVFKPFFSFTFFFYLNKFNIVIDSYNKYNNQLRYLAKINKTKKKEKKDYKSFIKHVNKMQIKKKEESLYDIAYIFRYKTKFKFKWKKWKKFRYLIKPCYIEINKNTNNMIFFLFYWKYFVFFLGLKMRLKYNNFKSIHSFINI